MEKRNTENSNLQIKIERYQMDNEMLVDKNVILMNKITLMEKHSKMRFMKLVILFRLE